MAPLSFDVRDHIAWITLNRPETGNAIDQKLLLALGEALTQAQESRNDIRCIVLTGAGNHFCSGIDLRSMQVPRTDSHGIEGHMKRRFVDHAVERLLALRVPIIAAVNGAAAGSGMTLALTADVIVMAADAYFLPSFVRRGLVPDNGISYLLSERIGTARAKAVLLLGDRIESRTAKEWGLAYQVVSSEGLRAMTDEFAARLAAGPKHVLAVTRNLLSHLGPRGFRQQFKAEREARADAMIAQECVEGCAAFLEHREPKF